MKRALVFFIFFFVFNFFIISQSFAVTVTPTSGPRYAVCDQCGYCPPSSPPSSWSACQKCLYPSINPDPAVGDSLKIDPTSGLAPTPYFGQQYTFLGCLSTGAGSLTKNSGVLQIILKTIFSIIGGIAFLYLLYGAFILATSQNDPEKLNYGKRLIYGAIIGLIFSLTSVLLINFMASQILKIPGFSS